MPFTSENINTNDFQIEFKASTYNSNENWRIRIDGLQVKNFAAIHPDEILITFSNTGEANPADLEGKTGGIVNIQGVASSQTGVDCSFINGRHIFSRYVGTTAFAIKNSTSIESTDFQSFLHIDAETRGTGTISFMEDLNSESFFANPEAWGYTNRTFASTDFWNKDYNVVMNASNLNTSEGFVKKHHPLTYSSTIVANANGTAIIDISSSIQDRFRINVSYVSGSFANIKKGAIVTITNAWANPEFNGKYIVAEDYIAPGGGTPYIELYKTFDTTVSGSDTFQVTVTEMTGLTKEN